MENIRSLDDDTRRHVDRCLQRMRQHMSDETSPPPPAAKHHINNKKADRDMSSRFPAFESVLIRMQRGRTKPIGDTSDSDEQQQENKLLDPVIEAQHAFCPWPVNSPANTDHQPCHQPGLNPRILHTPPLQRLVNANSLSFTLATSSSDERLNEFKKLRAWRESRHKAAVMIQCHWRGFFARKVLAEEAAYSLAHHWMQAWKLRAVLEEWGRMARVRVGLRAKIDKEAVLPQSAHDGFSLDEAMKRGQEEGGRYGMAKAFSDFCVTRKGLSALAINAVARDPNF